MPASRYPAYQRSDVLVALVIPVARLCLRHPGYPSYASYPTYLRHSPSRGHSRYSSYPSTRLPVALAVLAIPAALPVRAVPAMLAVPTACAVPVVPAALVLPDVLAALAVSDIPATPPFPWHTSYVPVVAAELVVPDVLVARVVRTLVPAALVVCRTRSTRRTPPCASYRRTCGTRGIRPA
ncbi:MAG TPA: hypothetical protein VFF46_38410 [Kribbella sp.]|nr:hypothetical protein [Kribbella sp.]